MQGEILNKMAIDGLVGALEAVRRTTDRPFEAATQYNLTHRLMRRAEGATR